MNESKKPLERRLAAILAADIVGYSRLMDADEEGTLAALNSQLSEFIEPAITEHQGRIVKLMGDGLLVEFPSAVAAMRCALVIQRGMAERVADLPEDKRIKFRIGINVGDAIIQGDDIYGGGVNVAARLEALADPSGILISGTVYDQVVGKLDCDFDFIGEQHVKNIDQPIRTYRVLLDKAAFGQTAVRKPPRESASWRQPSAAVLAAVIVVAAALGYWLWPTENAEARPASLAVLALDSFSDDPDQEYFADGLTEDMITELARNKGLLVMSRNTTFSFKGQGLKAEEIARELGVKYVLEGSVRQVGDNIRLNVQLIDGTTGQHVWAEKYDRPANEIIELQDEIIHHVSGHALSEIRRSEEAQADRRPVNDFDAYALTLKGMTLKHKFTPDAYKRARDLLARAIELDPQLALAPTILGYLNTVDIAAAITDEVSEADLDREIERIRGAIALDPQLSYAYQALALALTTKGDVDGALKAASKAVELAPGDAENYMQLAFAQGSAGQFEEAVASIKQAYVLNPRYPVYYPEVLARALFGLENYEEAIDVAADGLQVQSDYVLCQMWLAAAQMGAGQIEDASAAVGQLLGDTPGFTLEIARLNGFPKRPDRTEALLTYLKDAGIPES